ncbi:c-type cytochrome [Thioclava nitratireducens]|uniref:c-type cytochrome n=1 Tax=Thioclava nitratireducens TaxID=1915078 RepID=UPI0024804E47|nr:cytochrome c [Thioclava nitratireducens]WGT51092.1 cytochrome c [Thioclava nitratireducens]
MRKPLLALTLTLAATASFAQSPKDAVEARQGYFDLLGAQMAVLAPMAQGKTEFDAAKAQTAADNIAALAKVDIRPLFVEGTSVDDMMETHAKSEIWSNMDLFGQKLDGLHQAAAEMPAAAGSLDTLQPAVGKLGGACKSCHDEFRAK